MYTMSAPATLRSVPPALARRFFGVAVRPQTYLNLLYLALLFPLGLTYFVALTVGFAFSLALSITIVGIPLFLLFLVVVRETTAAERVLAETLLDADIAVNNGERPDELFAYLKRLVLSLSTWRGVVFLASKFVLGLGAFVGLVFAGSITFAFLSIPLYYRQAGGSVQFISIPETVTLSPTVAFELQTIEIGLTVPFQLTSVYVDSLPDAIAVSLVGVLLALVTLHLVNGAGWLLRRYCAILLGNTHTSDVLPVLRGIAVSDAADGEQGAPDGLGDSDDSGSTASDGGDDSAGSAGTD
jgi:hypothetical protein